MARGVGEGVDLELGESGFGDFGEKPVHDAATFDAALAVQDKDDFFGAGGLEGLFEDDAAGADVSGAVVEVALNEAFDEVEDDALSGGVEVVLVCVEKEGGRRRVEQRMLTLGFGFLLFRVGRSSLIYRGCFAARYVLCLSLGILTS